MPVISPLAVVEPGATLADDVRVGPFAFIGAGVSVGAGGIIESNATVAGQTRLGEGVHVFPMAVLGAGADPRAPAGACVVGARNVIREHVTVYAAPAGGCTEIGEDNLIMVASRIGPGARVGSREIFANATDVGAGACVEDYVRTSGFTMIGEGTRVGAYSFVAGFARVEGHAPPYAMLQGDPCRVRGVNTENLKRCGFPEEDIRALKLAFRRVFPGPSDAPDMDAVAEALADPRANRHVRLFAQALRDAASGGRASRA